MEIKKSPEEIKNHVHQRLQEYNSSYMKEYQDFSFHMEAGGAVIAGIVAESVLDTIEVQYLYVEEEYRKQGIGRSLLSVLEDKGRIAGMRRIFLNTYSFQAPGFYTKCGYKPIAEITPCFGNHSQVFFIKEINH